MGIASDLIVIVIAALIGGVLAHLVRQPLVCGFILAGVLVGPHTSGYTVKNIDAIEKLAEIGVALLLFTLGLEFSFGELRRLARITLFLTPLQIVLTSLAGFACSRAMGLAPSDALWLGAAISLSSTMVVLKTLASRDALNTLEGKVMLAVLIAQDLAIVPLMLVLPQLGADSVDISQLFAAGGKSVLFLLGMYVAGTRILPLLFAVVALQRSRELFFLSTLGFALGAGFLSHELGLSFALGAFVAGMLLSETDFNHQALSDVAHLRDLFAVIFFVSVGMLFNPNFIIDHAPAVLILVALVVLVKTAIIGALVWAFGYGARVAMAIGLGLAQVGEFAFVIMNVGRGSGAISQDSYSLMISTAVVSMMLTPLLFSLGIALLRRVSRSRNEIVAERVDASEISLSNHVVVVGGGVVGRYVARVLNTLELPYVVVESDYKVVTQLRDHELDVVFGDGSHAGVLKGAGVERARLVVVTTTHDALLPEIVSHIRSLHATVPVVVRVEDVEDVNTLTNLRVQEVVQPQLEVGLEMVRQALVCLRVDIEEIVSVLNTLRAERYEPRTFAGIGEEKSQNN